MPEGSTVLLSAILEEVGGSDYLKTFISEDQDDDCIPSFKKAEKIARDYGMPLPLASNFVIFCRAAHIVQRLRNVLGAPRSTVLLSAILEEVGGSEHLQTFNKEEADDDYIPSFKKSDKVAREYGLPPSLALQFVNMCQAASVMQRIIGAIAHSLPAVPRFNEVVIFRPQDQTSSGEKGGGGAARVAASQQQPPPGPAYTTPPNLHSQQAQAADEDGSTSVRSRLSKAVETLAKFAASVSFKNSQRRNEQHGSIHSDGSAASIRASHAELPRNQFAASSSDLQIAISTSVGTLPLSYSEYTLDMEVSDFNTLTQQLVVVPPHDRITVACCHRLTPRIRRSVRLGSNIARLALLNYKGVVVQEWSACPTLAIIKSITAQFAFCATVKVVFYTDIIPIQVPFILPDAFSEVCMNPSCKLQFSRFDRDYCRCCGHLFCFNCCNKEMPLPNYSMKKSHRVCDSCHGLFSCAPDTHWTPSWILQKRREAFTLATEKFTDLLDLIEKRPHAQRLGLDSERLWKADDLEFKQAKLQLNKSHPDAVGLSGGDASQSSANFSDIKDSCSLLVEWLSIKELHFHENLVSSSPMALFDESCQLCNRKFALISIECKKHYCRICGLPICGRPTCFKKDGRILSAVYGYGSSPVSVCIQCDQQYPVTLHPLVLAQDSYIDYFARLVDVQQEELKQHTGKRNVHSYLAPMYMSRLHVVSSVEVLDPQICRVHLFFCSSMTLEQSDTVTQDLGRLKCTVNRPLVSFEFLRKCLLTQGYPKEIVPELNTKIPRGAGIFLNAVLQHKRLRNSPLIPLFCSSSDSWDELQKILSRVSQGTDAALPAEIPIKSLPPILPCAAILELLNVLSCCGMLSLWGPLTIKFFSIAQFLTEAIDNARRYEDRLSTFHARMQRFAERTSQAQRFAVFFEQKELALKNLLQKSLERLSRERLRLANQRSSVHPIFVRRQQDVDNRKADLDWYQLFLEEFNQENKRFEADELASQEDCASCEKLMADCIKALDFANKVQSSHHDWMFEALSSLKLGKTLPAIIPAITDLEEQLSTVSKKTRDDLAAERSELDQQRVALIQEVHMNTLESSGGQFACISSLKSILDQFQTSVKCEEADISSEAACRSEKIARIEADILRVERVIQQSETALEKRVAQRNELYTRISTTIVNVQNSSEQCRKTVPLLQSTVLETRSTDSSVRERIVQQASTIIVLKKMKDTLQPVRTGILQRCEQAAQFVSLQTNLVSDVGTVVLQAREVLETQLQEDWALPLDFSYQATSLEKGDVDPEDLEMVPFREKRAEFEKRVNILLAAQLNGEREQCEEFQQRIESLVSALNTLQNVDVKAVSNELVGLNSCIVSWGAMFEEERSVNEAAKQAAVARVTQMFDRLSDLQHQANKIFGEQTAWIEEMQQKCSNAEFVMKNLSLHTNLEILIRAASTDIADLRRQVDALMVCPVSSPRTVQLQWNTNYREMQAAIDKFEKNYDHERLTIDRNIQSALSQTENLGLELKSQRLERLEVLSAATYDVILSVAALQQDSKQALALLHSNAVIDDEFMMWFNDRCSQASTTQVPLVQSGISRAQSIIVDCSEQQFLNGITRARDELVLAMPRITDLHGKLLRHNDVRRSYYDVATTVLDNLANDRNVYVGVDYTTLTRATQQLLGQATSDIPLPVPYTPIALAAQPPPGDQ